MGTAIKHHVRGVFVCIGWQLILCDPKWQVTPRSSEIGSQEELIQLNILIFDAYCVTGGASPLRVIIYSACRQGALILSKGVIRYHTQLPTVYTDVTSS